MTVDLTPESGGRWHFSLGPVEKWALSGVGAGLLLLTWWLIASVQTLLTQQALTNQRLQDISGQLAGVPELSTRVTRLEIRAEQNRADIVELQRLREVR